MPKRYDFQPLKRAVCFGFLQIDVPARWQWQRSEDGMWGFYEEDEESGTLWVDYDLYRIPSDTTGDVVGPLAERLMGMLAEGAPGRTVEKLATDDGVTLIRAVHDAEDTEEEGVMLRFFRYELMRRFTDHLVNVHYSLVIPDFRLRDPDMQELVEIVDNAIKRSRILGVPPEALREGAAAASEQRGLALQPVAIGGFANILVPQGGKAERTNTDARGAARKMAA